MAKIWHGVPLDNSGGRMEVQTRVALVTESRHPVVRIWDQTARLTLDASMTDAEVLSAWHDFVEIASLANGEFAREVIDEESNDGGLVS